MGEPSGWLTDPPSLPGPKTPPPAPLPTTPKADPYKGLLPPVAKPAAAVIPPEKLQGLLPPVSGPAASQTGYGPKWLTENAMLGNTPAGQVLGLDQRFADPFSQFVAAAKQKGLTFQFESGKQNYSDTHYDGRAADGWFHDGKGNDLIYPQAQGDKFPEANEKAKELYALAEQFGVGVLDEYVSPSAKATGPHFHFFPKTKMPTPKQAGVMASGRVRTQQQMDDVINGYAGQNGIDDVDSFKRLLNQESGYKSVNLADPDKRKALLNITSPVGAVGIGQFMPETLDAELESLGVNPQTGKKYTRQDYLTNENLQIRLAAKHYGDNLKHFGSSVLAAAAHNAGAGGAQRFLDRAKAGVAPAVDYGETRDYLSRIFNVPDSQVDSLLLDPKYRYDSKKALNSKVKYDPNITVTQGLMDTAKQTLWPKIDTQQDADYVYGVQVKSINQAMLGLPGLMGYHPTKEFMDWDQARWDQGGWLSWMNSTINVLAAIPMSVVLAETGGMGLTGFSNMLTQGAAAGKFSKPVAEFVGKMIGEHGVTGLKEFLKWSGVGALEGFNHAMGEEFAAGKDFHEALPAGYSGMMMGGVWGGLVGSVMLPFGIGVGASWARGGIGVGASWARGGMEGVGKGAGDMLAGLRAGAVGTGTVMGLGATAGGLTGGLTGQDMPSLLGGMAAGAGAGLALAAGGKFSGPEIAKLIEAGIAAIPKPVRAASTAATKKMMDGLSGVERQFFVDWGMKVSRDIGGMHANREMYNAFSGTAEVLEGSAKRLDDQAATFEREQTRLAMQVNDAQTQAQKLGTVHKAALTDPINAKFDMLRNQEAAINRQMQQMAAKPPVDPKQAGLLQKQLAQVGKDLEALRAKDAKGNYLYPQVPVFETLDAEFKKAGQALQSLTDLPAWKDRADIAEQIVNSKAIAEHNRKTAAEYADAVERQDIARPSATVIPGPFSAKASGAMEQIHESLLQRVSEGVDGLTWLPGEKEMILQTTRTGLDALDNPARTLTALESMEQNLADWIKTNKFKDKTAEELAVKQHSQLKEEIATIKSFPAEMTEDGMRAIIQGANPANRIAEMQKNGIPLGAFGKIPEIMRDPNLVQVNRENLARASSQWMLEAGMPTATPGFGLEAAPSLRAYREFSEMAHLLGHDIDENGMARQMSEMRKMMSATKDVNRAMDTYAQNSVKLNQSPNGHNEIAGATMNLGSFMMQMNQATKVVGDWAGKWTRGAFEKVLGLKPGEDMAQRFPDLSRQFVAAIEGDKKAAMDLLKANPKHVEPLLMFTKFQAEMERLKIWSPEMKDSFLEHYMLHMYPRLRKFKAAKSDGNPWDDDTATSARLGTEKQRKIPLLTDPNKRLAPEDYSTPLPAMQKRPQNAEELASTAEGLVKTLSGGKITWKEYVALPTDAMRVKALGNQVTRDEANRLLHDVLLGGAILDPSVAIRQSVESVMKTNSMRMFLKQLKNLDDPFSGSALITRAEGQTVPMGMMQKGSFGKLRQEPYRKLTDIPGTAGYKLDGADAREWLIHPQAADIFERYFTWGGKPSEGLGKFFEDGISLFRGLQLVGSPMRHTFSILSNHWLASGFDMWKAVGLAPMGRFVQLDNPTMALRAVQAGLQPQNMLRNVTKIHEDLLGSPESANALAELTGKNPMKQAALLKLADGFNKGVDGIRKTGEWFLAGDSFLNRMTLFDSINNSQIAGWMVETSKIWQAEGSNLIAKHGYSAGVLEAERLAASIVNKRSGTIPTWWLSSDAREVLYKVGLAPNYLAAKVDTIVGMMDPLFTRFGARSRFAHQMDPMVRAKEMKMFRNFLLGSMVADVVGTQILSYLTTGESTLANPPGKKMHIRISRGPNGEDTYISSPGFGMFHSIVKALTAGSEGNVQAIGDAVMGQVVGTYETMYQMFRNQNRYGRPIAPPMGPLTDVSAEGLEAKANTMKTWGNYFAAQTLPTGDLFGPLIGIPQTGKLQATDDYPTPGTPVSGRDWSLGLLGVYPTKDTPYSLTAAKGIDASIKVQQAMMDAKIDAGLREWSRNGYDTTEEGRKILQDTIRFAMVEGIPVGDPEMRNALRPFHPSGHFVLTDFEGFAQRMADKRYPHGAAFQMIPDKFKMLLIKRLQAVESARNRDIIGKNLKFEHSLRAIMGEKKEVPFYTQ